MPTNKEIMAAAEAVYQALPDAKLDRDGVIALAKARDNDTPFAKLPIDVKMPLVRLAVKLRLAEAFASLEALTQAPAGPTPAPVDAEVVTRSTQAPPHAAPQAEGAGVTIPAPTERAADPTPEAEAPGNE